jgi:hypothetical protein
VRDREREQGITPDHDAEAYMKAVEMAGKQSVKAQLFLRLLGLEGCADTVVSRLEGRRQLLLRCAWGWEPAQVVSAR